MMLNANSIYFIEWCDYHASKKGLDNVGDVTSALSNITFDKKPTQVLIQSDDTSVQSKFKRYPILQKGVVHSR